MFKLKSVFAVAVVGALIASFGLVGCSKDETKAAEAQKSGESVAPEQIVETPPELIDAAPDLNEQEAEKVHAKIEKTEILTTDPKETEKVETVVLKEVNVVSDEAKLDVDNLTKELEKKNAQ